VDTSATFPLLVDGRIGNLSRLSNIAGHFV
jgi:hypothetical protein